MDVFSAVAVLSGLVGAVLGALGWWKARSAMAAAAACHRRVQEQEPVDRRPPVASAAANGAVAAAPPSAPLTVRVGDAPALPAPHAAPEADGVRGMPIDAKTAALVVRPGGEFGHDLPTNQGTGSGLLGVFVVNEGPAVAKEIRLYATFPDGAVRSSEIHRSLSARKEKTLFAQVLPQDFGPGASIEVLYRVAYHDGNGEQTLHRKVRLDGGWKGPWKTFLEADPGASPVLPSAEPPSAPGLSPTRD